MPREPVEHAYSGHQAPETAGDDKRQVEHAYADQTRSGTPTNDAPPTSGPALHQSHTG